MNVRRTLTTTALALSLGLTSIACTDDAQYDGATPHLSTTTTTTITLDISGNVVPTAPAGEGYAYYLEPDGELIYGPISAMSPQDRLYAPERGGEGLPAPLIGDDNGDGQIEEDESGWDCSTMGNQQCGTIK